MPYLIDKEDRKIFQTQGFLRYDDLVSSKLEGLLKTLDHRSGDCWREESSWKQELISSRYTSVMHQLCSCNARLRLGATRCISSAQFGSTFTLSQLCSIQPIVGAILVPLDTPSPPLFFISPTALLVPSTFAPFNAFLCILYAEQNALAVFNPQDPFRNELKKLGYAAGDRLIDAHHPRASSTA